MHTKMLPISILALAAAVMMSAWAPAHADTPTFAPDCQSISAATHPKVAKATQEYLAGRMSAGATHVELTAPSPGSIVVCTW